MSDEGWRTDTAERAPVRLSQDPSPDDAPPAFPAVEAAPVGRPRRPLIPSWVAWVVVHALLLGVAVVGIYLVLRDTDPSTATDPAEAGASEKAGKDKGSSEEQAPEGDDLTASASVAVPAAAPDNSDVNGEVVTFAGGNLLDGDPTTCWRVAGDATGSVLTFTFPDPVTLTEVGLVNGYARTSVDDAGQSYDWYHGNRRVLSADWVIEGQTYAQDFTDTRKVQSLPLESVQTTEVQLLLTSVSLPGPAPIGRDYTAVSEVRLTGVAG
jgi:hypothetical protein